MAENNKIQLKREENVGNEVVLSDIFPRTDTESIEDSSRGVSLNQTLDRIFNYINDKVSRLVNSVNGKSGVVVVTADDIGLGNVTNVSFTDIKRWVLEQLKLGFNNHQLQLFTSMEEAVNFANTHGEEYNGTPFYCDHGFIYDQMTYKDYRATIGVFIYDDTQHHLTISSKSISTIGDTDKSIIYNEKIEYNDPNIPDRDYRGGKIGVNIHPGEDALKLREGNNKSDSGLYIDKDKIISQVYFFDGAYGKGDADDKDALFYYDLRNLDVSTLNPCNVYIDDNPISLRMSRTDTNVPALYLRQSFKVNDIIIINFSYRDGYHDRFTLNNRFCIGLKEGMIDGLTCDQVAVGKVTQAPTTIYPELAYEIHFNTIKPNVNGGLKLQRTNYAPSNEIAVDIIESKPTRAVFEHGREHSQDFIMDEYMNLSGVNAFKSNDESWRTKSYDDYESGRVYYTMLPTGKTRNVFEDDPSAHNPFVYGDKSNGLHISPNYSLCLIPRNAFDSIDDEHPEYGNKAGYAINWPITAPANVRQADELGSDETLIGINLEKKIIAPNNDITYVQNKSGLRISTESEQLTKKWFGYSDNDQTVVLDNTDHTGGLSVNVGKFLDIGSDDVNNVYPYGPEYYDQGKVNVRIKEHGGLTDGGNNDLKVELYSTHMPPRYSSNDKEFIPNGGLQYSTTGETSDYDTPGIGIARGLGLRLSAYNSNHELTDYCSQIAVSIFDPGFGTDDIRSLAENQKKPLYGGLRYLAGGSGLMYYTAIGIRVNETEDLYDDIDGTKIKKGTLGLCISPHNVLGVQLPETGDGGLSIDSNGCLVSNAIITDYTEGASYKRNNLVVDPTDEKCYRVLVAYTASGNIADDLAANKLILFSDPTA